jgi:long-subunit acyl-CoA synthetase (AMP-forming)
VIRSLFAIARYSWPRRNAGGGGVFDDLWFALGQKLIFGKIKERLGPNLRALI